MLRSLLVSQLKRIRFCTEFYNNTNRALLSTTPRCFKVEDRKEMLASLPQKDEGTAGENSIEIDAVLLQ